MKKILFVLILIITVIIGITIPAYAERIKYSGVARTSTGTVLGTATVSTYLAGTTTPAGVYTASSGGAAVYSVTSDTGGRFTFYVDTADYGFVQQFKVVATKDGYETVSLDNIYELQLPTDAAGYLRSNGAGAYSWADGTFDEAGDYVLTGTIDASGATVTWPATLAADIHVDDILTALGIASEAVNFGTFTGATIADNQTAKAAMQALETALELKAPMASPTFSGTITVTGLGTGIVQVTADEISSTTTISTATFGGFTASTPLASDGSGNATTLSSQNVITTGYIDGGILVTKSTDATVTVSGMSKYYVNADDDVIAFNLPADPTNKGFCFANTLYAKAITVNPDDADYILMDGVAGAAGESVVSTGAADEQLCVLGIDTSYWKVTSKVGTWAQETPP